jgi:hypothetical protein
MVTHADLLTNGPADSPDSIVLAHGAGRGMDSPFMTAFAEGLAEAGLFVARFEFPYMAQSRRDGKRRPPNAAGLLMQTWRQVIDTMGGPHGLVIGGKSMGGRMASLVARELEQEGTPVAGVACLGYPFHPPGKPETLRLDHLRAMHTPTLIVQGTRDPFGGADEVANYDLPDSVRIHWTPDGDHHLTPRKSSGYTTDHLWQDAVADVAAFVRARRAESQAHATS